MKKLSLLTLAAILLSASTADARTMALLRNEVNELDALAAASIASGDYVPVYDASAGTVKKVDATELPLGGEFNGIVGGTTPAAGEFTSITGTSLVIDAVTIDEIPLKLAGRATISICGDGTTINNNTVYYGPSQVPVASGERTCDITQAGNVTEATADAPAFTATAFQVLGMDCLTADPGASGVSFTLRSAAAATTPSVTCSVANTATSCVADVQTTTAIASGATLAIAAASAGDQGATPFACQIHVAY